MRSDVSGVGKVEPAASNIQDPNSKFQGPNSKRTQIVGYGAQGFYSPTSLKVIFGTWDLGLGT